MNLTRRVGLHLAPLRLSESDEEIEILLGEETQISERVLKRADLARPEEAE